MLPLLLVLFYFSQLVQGTSTNITDSTRPPHDDGTTRSVWSILGSCTLTLLICVWHTIHFDLPRTQDHWYKTPAGLVLVSFFAPELVVAFASKEWLEARQTVNRFYGRGYEWSMTHAFFAAMGGFVYRNDKGYLNTIDSFQFLDLCEDQKITNPDVTAKDIKDRGKSDSIGKAILAIQLLWFMLQVVVRGSSGLAITLVKLDTVCMAVLSLLVLLLWWDKPLRPGRPHLLYYSPPGIGSVPTKIGLDKRIHSKYNRMLDNIDEGDVVYASLCATWAILGGLHLIAWNFDFPTETEKLAWRVASLVLAGGSPVFFGMYLILWKLDPPRWVVSMSAVIWVSAFALGVVARALLVALMLASLRALPYSAYQTVSWTTYIPHL